MVGLSHEQLSFNDAGKGTSNLCQEAAKAVFSQRQRNLPPTSPSITERRRLALTTDYSALSSYRQKNIHRKRTTLWKAKHQIQVIKGTKTYSKISSDSQSRGNMHAKSILQQKRTGYIRPSMGYKANSFRVARSWPRRRSHGWLVRHHQVLRRIRWLIGMGAFTKTLVSSAIRDCFSSYSREDIFRSSI